MVPAQPQNSTLVLDSTPIAERLVLYRDQSDPRVLEAHQRLWSFSPYSPFQQFGWLESWQSHVGDRRRLQPVTIIGYTANQPVLLLPLSVERSFMASSFVWRAEDFCDYCGPLLHPSLAATFDHAALHGILHAAGRALGGIDLARLQKIPMRAADFASGHVGTQSIPYHVSAHATRLNRDWQAYARSKRSGKTLRKIKARLTTLESLGRLEIAFASNRAEAMSLIVQSLDLKAAQLRKLGYWNPLTGRGAAAMLLACFGGRVLDSTWVAAVRLDGKPLAVSYGFRSDRAWLVYQLAMDQDSPHAHLSPGTHLLMFLLKHCCEQGVETFDLSLGDEDYKTDWCEMRATLVTEVMAFSWRGRVRLQLFSLASRIRRAISSRPTLYSAAKILNRNLKFISARAW